MTKQEYEMLQKRLTNKLCRNSYGTIRGPKCGDAYREGLREAKSVLHDFYQEFGEDTFGEDTEEKQT